MAKAASNPAVSVVMPCLNEAETLERCILAAQNGMAEAGLGGEVIVADNGSTDDSQAIAEKNGAVVITVSEPGYGAAVRGGIQHAKGHYIVMGDADDSYDYAQIPALLKPLQEGADLVMGNRFSGGVDPGAMPRLHRYVGNPVLSKLGRTFFHTPVHDFHCGLRAFTKAAYQKMELVTTGMEFASEMVVKASLMNMRIVEVPVHLRKDGRSRSPHLRTWRDGWRHLRFLLMYCPRWLFLIPGILLLLLGVAGSAWLLGGPRHIGGVEFDIHALLIFGASCMVGYQTVLFALFTKVFVVREGLHPPSSSFERLFHYVNLELGLTAGAASILGGVALTVAALVGWGQGKFGDLDPQVTMRLIIPAVVLFVLGVQTLLASFFLSILGLERAQHIGQD